MQDQRQLTTTNTNLAPPLRQTGLFSNKSPSAFKVIDVTNTKVLLEYKMKEGFRWVTPNFINDEGYDLSNKYTGYYVGHSDQEPTQAADLGTFDVILCDIIFQKDDKSYKKIFFINEESGQLDSKYYSAEATDKTIKTHLDGNYGDKLQIKTRNPVAKARQMPVVKEGDWVVMEGKSMRLVKNDVGIEKDLDLKLVGEAEKAGLSITELQCLGIPLPANYFPNSYARIAAAYTRRLERYQHLGQVFERFFDVKEFDENLKCPVIDAIKVSLYGQTPQQFTSFKLAVLNEEELTSNSDSRP